VRASGAAILCAASSAWAFPVQIAGQDGTASLTETAGVAYHLDNGNIAKPPDEHYDPTGDNYFDWLNRFDAQLSWKGWHAELRFDSALFLNTPSVAGSLSDPENLHLARLLENRYVNNFVLEKISVDYTSPHFDLALGDFYLSYGRGLVVSMLKLDALGVDTTLRGLNLTGRWAGLTANLAAGVTNTINTDEAT